MGSSRVGLVSCDRSNGGPLATGSSAVPRSHLDTSNRLPLSIIRRRPTSRFEHFVCRYSGAPFCHTLLNRAVTWPFLDGLRAGNEMGFLGFHGNKCIMIPRMRAINTKMRIKRGSIKDLYCVGYKPRVEEGSRPLLSTLFKGCGRRLDSSVRNVISFDLQTNRTPSSKLGVLRVATLRGRGHL